MNANQPQQSWDMPPPPSYEEVQPQPQVQAQPEQTVVAPAPIPVQVSSLTPDMSSQADTGSRFGKLFKILGAGMGLLLGIALLVGSALLMVRKGKGIETEATVTSASCKENTTDTSKGIYTCELELKYIDLAGKEVTAKKTVYSNTEYSNAQKVTVYYSSETPSEVELTASNNKTLGWILFGIGMVIFIAAAIAMYFTLRTPSFPSPVM